MVDGLPRVFALDRRRVRERAVARFGVERMVDEYVAVYSRIVEAHRGRRANADARSRAAPCSRIFAHPDDESLACGGTLARLADAGARVVADVRVARRSADRSAIPRSVPDGDLGRVRVRGAARRRRGRSASPR